MPPDEGWGHLPGVKLGHYYRCVGHWADSLCNVSHPRADGLVWEEPDRRCPGCLNALRDRQECLKPDADREGLGASIIATLTILACFVVIAVCVIACR